MVNDQSELSTWLEELEAEQARTALVIASLRQRLGLDPSAPPRAPAAAAAPVHAPANPTQHHQHLRADTFFGMTVPEAIKRYLAIVKRPQSPKAIGDALKQGGVLSQAADFYANVSTSLKRLTISGDVVNTKEGWGLASWYPNRKAVEAAKSKPKKKGTIGSKSRRSAAGGPSGAAKPVTSMTAAPRPAGAKRQTATMSGWHEFLANSLKEGKSMKDAAAAWKARPQASP